MCIYPQFTLSMETALQRPLLVTDDILSRIVSSKKISSPSTLALSVYTPQVYLSCTGNCSRGFLSQQSFASLFTVSICFCLLMQINRKASEAAQRPHRKEQKVRTTAKQR